MWRCSGVYRTSGWQCYWGKWVNRSGTKELKVRPLGYIRHALQDRRETARVLMSARQRRETGGELQQGSLQRRLSRVPVLFGGD